MRWDGTGPVLRSFAEWLLPTILNLFFIPVLYVLFQIVLGLFSRKPRTPSLARE